MSTSFAKHGLLRTINFTFPLDFFYGQGSRDGAAITLDLTVTAAASIFSARRPPLAWGVCHGGIPCQLARRSPDARPMHPPLRARWVLQIGSKKSGLVILPFPSPTFFPPHFFIIIRFNLGLFKFLVNFLTFFDYFQTLLWPFLYFHHFFGFHFFT